MKNELTDKELLDELQQRFDKNKVMLEAERKLIHQLNEVNQKLVESEKVKSNFLSNIRNEINNPIASILELSKNLSGNGLSSDLQKTCAEMIHSEAFDLDFQLRNIFMSAELEAGKAPLSAISVDIKSLVDSVLASFQSKMNKKQIQLNVNHQITDGTIFRSDSEKVHLVLSNIISNAIQFNIEGGSIRVSTSIASDILTVEISDTGIGIDAKDMENIYNRFHQIESGSTKSYGGHGLGLSVTKALLEIIGGDIHLESKLGAGTTFVIKINDMVNIEMGDDVFSSDGNDFLFDQSDDMLF